MKKTEKNRQEETNKSNLEIVIEIMKDTPRIAIGSVIYISSFVPFIASYSPLLIDVINHVEGNRTPSLREYGFDVALMGAGIYASWKCNSRISKFLEKHNFPIY